MPSGGWENEYLLWHRVGDDAAPSPSLDGRPLSSSYGRVPKRHRWQMRIPFLWRDGVGDDAAPIPSLEDGETKITGHLATLQQRRMWFTFLLAPCLMLFLISIFGSLPIFTSTPSGQNIRVSLAVTFFVAAMMPLVVIWYYTGRLRSVRSDSSDILNRQELLTLSSQSREQKAQKLLQIQQFELKRYYNQTLTQSKYIFTVGVVAMSLGFTIIGGSLYLVYDMNQKNPGLNIENATQKALGSKDNTGTIIVAVLGAIGVILTNFIGALYLRMFSQIVRAVNGSQASLVATSNLHFANILAANIDTIDLREKPSPSLHSRSSSRRPKLPIPKELPIPNKIWTPEASVSRETMSQEPPAGRRAQILHNIRTATSDSQLHNGLISS